MFVGQIQNVHTRCVRGNIDGSVSAAYLLSLKLLSVGIVEHSFASRRTADADRGVVGVTKTHGGCVYLFLNACGNGCEIKLGYIALRIVGGNLFGCNLQLVFGKSDDGSRT